MITSATQNSSYAAFDLPDDGPIAAVLCHFNPCLYRAPVANLYSVLNWLRSEGVPTYAAEVRSGPSSLEPPALPIGHPKVLQFLASGTMFRKDNLWNIVATQLPRQFNYVLCLDADVILTAPDWKKELLTELERTLIVQPFERAVWTDTAHNPFKEKMSCGYGFGTGAQFPQISHNFHSGFAIAAHRSFWTKTSGFYNCPIGGGSLFFMSAIMGLENELEEKLSSICPPLLAHYRKWSQEIQKWGGRRFGCTRGDAVHLWHGSRAKRRYRDRFDCLAGFDPKHDIDELAPFGLHDWTSGALSEKQALVRRVENYFVTREEDEEFFAG